MRTEERIRRLLPNGTYPNPRAASIRDDGRYLVVGNLLGGRDDLNRSVVHLFQKVAEDDLKHVYSWPLDLRVRDVQFASAASEGTTVVVNGSRIQDEGVFQHVSQVWSIGKNKATPLESGAWDESGWKRFTDDGRFLFIQSDDRTQVVNWQSRERVDLPIIPAWDAISADGSRIVIQRDPEDNVEIWQLNLRPRLAAWGDVKRSALLPNFPNPFNPETWIPFRLVEPGRVTVDIYGLTGRLVRSIDLGSLPAGNYLDRDNAAYWDGRNQAGERVSSGTYFTIVQAGGSAFHRRMVLAK